jgi:hypothetical protein
LVALVAAHEQCQVVQPLHLADAGHGVAWPGEEELFRADSAVGDDGVTRRPHRHEADRFTTLE